MVQPPGEFGAKLFCPSTTATSTFPAVFVIAVGVPLAMLKLCTMDGVAPFAAPSASNPTSQFLALAKVAVALSSAPELLIVVWIALFEFVGRGVHTSAGDDVTGFTIVSPSTFPMNMIISLAAETVVEMVAEAAEVGPVALKESSTPMVF